MSACGDKLLLLHALADGEIDAANALAIEAHLETCAACRAEYARILAIRTVLTAEPLGYPVSSSLRDNILARIDAEDRAGEAAPPRMVVAPVPKAAVARHVLNWRWASGAITGLAAGLALMIAIPRSSFTPHDDVNDLVAGQVRSLMANHLTDIQTSDKHVVKPWFNGRIDFAPPVPDLATDGFPLAGGRLDFIGGHQVAALVYHRRLHVINVFVAPKDESAGRPADTSHNGYNILRWTAGDLTFSAISDLNGKELQQFRDLFIAAAKG